MRKAVIAFAAVLVLGVSFGAGIVAAPHSAKTHVYEVELKKAPLSRKGEKLGAQILFLTFWEPVDKATAAKMVAQEMDLIVAVLAPKDDIQSFVWDKDEKQIVPADETPYYSAKAGKVVMGYANAPK